MSEPKRFNFSATIVHHIGGEKTAALKYHTDSDGPFVSYEDYARLKTEVERLTKAGDLLAVHYTALSKCVTPNNAKSGSINDWTSVIDWQAAKEGKQP